MAAPLILYKNFATANPATIVSGITITGAAGTVNGDAIYAVNYPWAIANYGVAAATGTTGIGVNLVTGGSLGNRGLIAGYKDGVAVGNTISGAAASVSNFGTITSPGAVGTALYAGAPTSLSNLGFIVASGIGTVSTTVNEGDLGPITIVSEVGGTGVDLAAGGSVVNGSAAMAATIEGAGGGIIIGGSGPGSVTNYGTIVGSGLAAPLQGQYLRAKGVYLKSGGEVNNVGDGALIEGYASYGVQIVNGTGAVTNAGTIEGAGVFAKTGVALGAGGAVTNGSASDTTASITSARIDGINLAAGAGTVANYGTVAGIRYGVYFGAGGTLINSGYIASGYSLHYSEHDAVRFLDRTTNLVVNSGTIGGTLGRGIVFEDGGTLDNTGIVNGGFSVYENDYQSLVQNAGTISGGVSLDGVLGSVKTIANSGLIDRVSVIFGAAVARNTGVISHGITLVASANPVQATIVNGTAGDGAALIGGVYGGSSGDGVTARIVNYGTILSTGTNGAGVDLKGNNPELTSGGTIVNRGMIAGTGPSGFGIELSSGGTIIDSGTISGANGTAVGGPTRLVVYPGAVFDGIVAGGSAGSVLELAAGASLGTLSGVGTTLVQFGTLTFDPGARWDVLWQTPFLRPAPFPMPVYGFQAGDTIDATGIVANADTYSGGVLTLVNSGSVVAQVTISTPYSNPDFSVGPDGGGGTDITVAPPYAAADPLMTNMAGSLVFDQVVGGQMVFMTIGALGPEWEFDGSGGNLLGDGNPGFLIRNTGGDEPGVLDVGEVNGSGVNYTEVGGLGLEWQFDGVADFLGTGQSEFLIRNTGAVEPGTLDLAQVVSGAMQYTQVGGLGLEWEFDGTGDFLNDGRNGFLIRNTGAVEPGALDVGEIVNGAAQYTPIGGVGTEWKFEGTGDFLGDGDTGFLIWNSGSAELGAMAIGEVVNGQLQFTDIGGVGPEWQFIGTGNYIDSNKTDFLLRNTGNGALVVGSVSGSTGNGSVSFTTVGGVGPEWTFHNTNPALMS